MGWRLNAQRRVSSFMASRNFSLITSCPKYPGQEFEQMGIGFSSLSVAQ
jgi:hypothetical protein